MKYGGCRGLDLGILDSEGILKALHALLEVFNLTLLLFQEQGFNLVQSRGKPVF
jgi:hypothetical protein